MSEHNEAWTNSLPSEEGILCWVWELDGDKKRPALIVSMNEEGFTNDYGLSWSEAEPVTESDIWRGDSNGK